VSILGEVAKGLSGEHRIVVDRREAIFAAIQMALPGDAVVIAGKGHENYQILGREKTSFDDRLVAAEALA
jgi:UDP-N-acetylmuramoyl-L-alanyl-D-glutamate--2,6-diaminopimelate ligase